jgi:hypothetical protein
MQKTLLLAVTLFLLASAHAKAQDAIGTFTFIFFDAQLDVTRSYGNEVTTSGPLPITVKLLDKCVFLATFNEGGREDVVERYDLNKAFFSEMRVFQANAAVPTAIVPGEKGVYYECRKGGCWEPTRGDEYETMGIPELTDRRVKALKYLITNFCPGTKRRSAF